MSRLLTRASKSLRRTGQSIAAWWHRARCPLCQTGEWIHLPLGADRDHHARIRYQAPALRLLSGGRR